MANKQIKWDLDIYRGDSKRIQMTFVNVDDQTGVTTPVDLTNLTVKLQARYAANDLGAIFELPWTTINAKQGLGYFNLTKTLSESLAAPYGPDVGKTNGVYDIQLWSKLDAQASFTPIYGNWVVRQDITREK
ncbi:hypothetical protein ACW5XW_23820 [Aeromonas piscicola]|uniref:hypothetical protein n=1 Tax=Aeromonas piscicola TaxID=600645 RepID=UPI0005B356D1|nr:hypothetical protein [Aeromonas piscicola]